MHCGALTLRLEARRVRLGLELDGPAHQVTAFWLEPAPKRRRRTHAIKPVRSVPVLRAASRFSPADRGGGFFSSGANRKNEVSAGAPGRLRNAGPRTRRGIASGSAPTTTNRRRGRRLSSTGVLSLPGAEALWKWLSR